MGTTYEGYRESTGAAEKRWRQSFTETGDMCAPDDRGKPAVSEIATWLRPKDTPAELIAEIRTTKREPRWFVNRPPKEKE